MLRTLKDLFGQTQTDPGLKKAQNAVDAQLAAAIRQRAHADKVADYMSRSRQENHYRPRLTAAFELERKPS